MDPFTIGEATPGRVGELLEMIGELAAFEHLEHTLGVTRESLRDALFGPRPAARALIADMGSGAAGYAVYYPTFSTFAGRPGVFLEDVYVRPPWRNRGLGRALLTEAARSGGAPLGGRYEWMALRWNEAALRFYRNLGARTLDEWVCVRMSGEPLRRLTEGETGWN